MTRKHIEALARYLRENRPGLRINAVGYDKAVMVVSYALESVNPAFDRKRFLKDCGLE